ncbi:hypothetical protein Acr_13g0009490 [Actinidia rufa]|uniref:MORF/ORRM1/DAG-like MORF domain-containing protein n=1 Tax=Actinidia rufa TaxID=165716 RepID=A0A7J0FN35_9ERIC|nr:hypothetical protein Acr_13g0009490 [Actinidia rufa]
MATTVAATVARSILTVRSPPSLSYLFASKRLISSIVRSPPLPGFLGPARSTSALSHSLRVVSEARVNPFRCTVESTGQEGRATRRSTWSRTSATGRRQRWLRCSRDAITITGSSSWKARRLQVSIHEMKSLLTLCAGDEEAKKKIYNVSRERYFGFGCEIDEETSNKLEGLPGVLFVLPDSYVDAENKDYGVMAYYCLASACNNI